MKSALTEFGKMEKKLYLLVDNLTPGRESNFFRFKIHQWIRLAALAKVTKIIKTHSGVQFVEVRLMGNIF